MPNYRLRISVSFYFFFLEWFPSHNLITAKTGKTCSLQRAHEADNKQTIKVVSPSNLRGEGKH